jgi:hypothetical protein
VNVAGLRKAHQPVRSFESPAHLNREATVTRRLPAGVVHNMHSHVWNSRKKNPFGGCKRRCKAETDLKLMRAKPTG